MALIILLNKHILTAIVRFAGVLKNWDKDTLSWVFKSWKNTFQYVLLQFIVWYVQVKQNKYYFILILFCVQMHTVHDNKNF